MFARAVDSNEALQNSLQDVVFWKNNCEVGEGVAIAKKYNVRGYPTFIMTNGDGQVSSAWIGYPGPERWMAYAHAGNLDRRTVTEKKEAYAEQPTKELACSLANSAATDYAFAEAVKYYRAAREMNPAGAQEYTNEILTNMYYGSRGGAFTLDEVKKEADFVMASGVSTTADKIDIASMVREMAAQMGDLEAAVPYIEAALQASENMEELAESRRDLEIDQALLVDKDPAKALDLKRSSLDEGWRDDPGTLNNFAWWCFQHGVNLEEARALALHGVEIAADDSQKSSILDTAAEICNALDNCSESVELIQRAVGLSPDREYYRKQLEKFQNLLQEQKEG